MGAGLALLLCCKILVLKQRYLTSIQFSLMKKISIVLSLVLLGFLSACVQNDIITFEEQLMNDLATIDNFLVQNDIDVLEHESGLRYVIDEEGEGPTATGESTIHAKFVGKLLNGNTFDSDLQGFSFRLDQLIEAWQIAVPLVKEGGKITIYAPSGYCFGPHGQASVGPNANLIFEIEVIDVDVMFDEQLVYDSALINNYLIENEIEALQHESGVRYVMTEEGSGDSPSSNDVVNVIYEGRFLSGEVFDSNSSGISFLLANLIPAWQSTIPLMKEGGKMTIYAPSGHCYGVDGRSNIPPNASLIFDIELVNVE